MADEEEEMKLYIEKLNDAEGEAEKKWQFERRIQYRRFVEESLGENRLARYKWSYCVGENKNKRSLTFETKNVALNKIYTVKLIICHSHQNAVYLVEDIKKYQSCVGIKVPYTKTGTDFIKLNYQLFNKFSNSFYL